MAYLTNNLADMRPDLAEQLICVYNKDGSVSDKTAKEVVVGSGFNAEWKCNKESGHSNYITAIESRTKKNNGCPTCSNKRVEEGINDLATTHPEIASQLICIYKTDGVTIIDKTAKDVTAGSNFKGKWKCDKNLGHSAYIATFEKKTKGSQCPTCVNQRVESGINDLATTHPEIASELVHLLNKDKTISSKTAKDVVAGSDMHGTWKCKIDNHSTWVTQVKNRTKNQATGCPTCSNKRVETGINDLGTTHPEIALELVNLLNKDKTVSPKTAKDIVAGSNIVGTWKCKIDNHSTFSSTVFNRVKASHSCPTCSNKRVKQGFNDLATTHPEISSELVSILDKNGKISNLTAKDVTSGSERKSVWKCIISDHPNYITSIYRRVNIVKTNGCPICSKKAISQRIRVEQGVNDLCTTHPEIASELVYLLEKDGNPSIKTSKEVGAGSKMHGVWKCKIDNHSYYPMRVNHRTTNHGCPTCANRRIEAGVNDFGTIHPEITSELINILDKNGEISELKPTDVPPGSDAKATWKCKNEKHPNYIATMNSRSIRGSGCPLCAGGKTEGIFRDSFSHQVKNNFLSARMPLKRELFTSGMAQIDMFCEDLNLVIEFDGAWAHGAVNNADKNITHEECVGRDIDTTIALIKAGNKVVRIREWDRYEKLQFIKIPAEYEDNLHQVTYKSFGKDKHDIDELVKSIIKEKEDWFLPTVDSKSAILSAL